VETGGTRQADYKNWIPNAELAATVGGTAAAGAGLAAWAISGRAERGRAGAAGALGLGLATGALAAAAGWSLAAHRAFSYKGRRQLSRRIVEGTAAYVTLPAGGLGLDVGCGSGALTIACAKANPQARMIGVDRWGPEYAAYSLDLCRDNARAEGVTNADFCKGNAVHLDFPYQTFDAVTSNYVYHNITGRDKQALLEETLRVLKKGGSFALHDLMTPARYGDMQAFCQRLRDRGYEQVDLIDTTRGLFLSPWEVRLYLLTGSALLVGIK
jgi:arsenite methyltransferase